MIQIQGNVKRGLGEGKQLGWPTANIEYAPLAPKLAKGVYAGWALLSEGRFPAAIIIGARPENPPLVEAHIIGWTGELYNTTITLEIHSLVSSIETFATVQDLKNKIEQDIIKIKNALKVE